MPAVFTTNAGFLDSQSQSTTVASTTFDAVAATSLLANKAVCMTVSGLNYADVTQATDAVIVGFTTADAANGATATVQTTDLLDGFSGLTAGSPIYLAASGAITQTVPTTGRLQVLGVAMSATQINIQIQMPVYL